MRTPHLRFTMRRMMAAVVVLALAIAAEQMRRRRDTFLARAASHARGEALARERIKLMEAVRSWERADGFLCGNAVRGILEAPAYAAYHAGLRRKYERAAAWPWLSVEPDPIPPWDTPPPTAPTTAENRAAIDAILSAGSRKRPDAAPSGPGSPPTTRPSGATGDL